MSKRLSKLTDRQKRFIDEYMKDQNAAQAAVRSGYDYASGDVVYAYPVVKKEIERRMTLISEAADVKAADVIREVWRVANSDIGDLFNANGGLKPLSELTLDQRRAISAVDEDEIFEGSGEDRRAVGVTKKVKLWDKVKALELLMKKFKLLTDRVEHDVTEDLAEAIREARLRRKNAK